MHSKLKGKKLFSKQFLKETFPYDVLYGIWNVCFNTATRDPMDPILDAGPVQRLRASDTIDGSQNKEISCSFGKILPEDQD